jgi:hypothetical protein
MNRIKKTIFSATIISIGTAISFTPAFAQFGIAQAPAQKISSEKVLSSGVGRYVFGQISDSSKDQYMLDTLTGRLWRIGETSSGVHLKEIPYRDDKGKVSPYPDGAPDTKPGESKGKEAPKK